MQINASSHMLAHLKKRIEQAKYPNWTSRGNNLGIKEITLENGKSIATQDIQFYEIFDQCWLLHLHNEVVTIRRKDRKLDLLIRGMHQQKIPSISSQQHKDENSVQEKDHNARSVIDSSPVTSVEVVVILTFLTVLIIWTILVYTY